VLYQDKGSGLYKPEKKELKKNVKDELQSNKRTDETNGMVARSVEAVKNFADGGFKYECLSRYEPSLSLFEVRV
jgi:predicted ester cyclase